MHRATPTGHPSLMQDPDSLRRPATAKCRQGMVDGFGRTVDYEIVNATVDRRQSGCSSPAMCRKTSGKPGMAEVEPITWDSNASFAFREFHLPRFTSPWHFHEEVELSNILEGRGRRFVGDSLEEYGPGDLVLLGSNLPHVWSSYSKSTSARYSHSLVIQFKPVFLGEPFLALPEWGPIRGLLGRAARGLRVEGTLRDRVAQRMAKMVTQSPTERLSGLIEMLAQLSAADDLRPLASSGFAPVLDVHAQRRINRAYQYVMANLSKTITLEGASAAAGMNSSAFSRYFALTMGKPFNRFVNELRIGRVCRDLMATDRSISELAFENGYESLSNFNRRFRELHCMTPQAFRRTHAILNQQK